LFVAAIGVRPNIELAQKAGFIASAALSSMIPAKLRSQRLAVGECVQHRGSTFGLVAPLFEQAKVCANI